MYKRLASFGGSSYKRYNNPELDAILSCPYQKLDIEFRAGSGPGTEMGYKSKNCQNFYAEYCGKEWTDICESFYQGDNDLWYPSVPQQLLLDAWPELRQCAGLTGGERLLQTACSRALFDFEGYNKVVQPINFADSSSYHISHYELPAFGPKKIVWNGNVAILTDDNRMLQNCMTNAKKPCDVLLRQIVRDGALQKIPVAANTTKIRAYLSQL